MEQFLQRFRSYIETNPLDTGDEEHPTVLDQLYLAYAESHKSDPPRSGTVSRSWRNFSAPSPWTTTTPSSTSAAASAPPTKKKPSTTELCMGYP